MYIVRWLTHHPIVAIWALTIIALLLSMGGEKKHKTDVASNEQVEVAKQTNQAIDEGGSVVEVKGTADTSTENHSDGGVAAVNNAAVAIPAVATNIVSADSSSASSTKIDDEVQQEALISGLDDKAIDDLLLMAREAFWNNGLDEAVVIYQQLIQREPKVVEHKGELANVYWKQGLLKKAASIYAEIAIPMIENGKADRVENMVGFIKQYHPEKVAEIEKHLQGLSK